MTTTPVRRRLAALLAVLLLMPAVVSSGASAADAGATEPSGVAAGPAVTAAAGVVLTPIVTGLTGPVQVTHAPGDATRLYVVEQRGLVRVIKNGVLLPASFINLTDAVSTGGERGLLGIAFHPGYATNGRFYVYFTRKGDGDIAINEYHRSSGNPDTATRTGNRRIITIDHPYANHNGGRLAFGPDGYLYIGTGDGGSTGDPGNRAQNKESLLGKMLRISVNSTYGARQYGIPRSNPFVGRAGRNEIWSYGLRNPWGWSFDRVTGDLWIADVGQNKYEEVNRSTVTATSTSRGRGVNYGWRTMEGRHCYRPATGCRTTGLHIPVVEYSHSEGCSVTGGSVYRGAAVPVLAARYVFADFCSGTIWSIPRNAAVPATKTLLLSTTMLISGFGEDVAGELYVLDLAGGALYRFDAG